MSTSSFRKNTATFTSDSTDLCQLPIVMSRSNKADFAWFLKKFKTQILPKPQRPLQRCLQSLAFPEMDNRSKDIDAAAEDTCEWLSLHNEYRNWVTCDQGLLWIMGKPGSGKSTLLRYALDNVIVASNIGTNPVVPSPVVLSFFFHGRGVELQRTLPGLFRSLLCQLLNRVPHASQDVVKVFQERYNILGENWQWHPNELSSLFKSSLLKTLEDHPIWLFIDALDESGEQNAVALVKILKPLVQKLPTVKFSLHICFSCRHYPIVDLDCTSRIYLEHENRRDIEAYVDGQLSEVLELTSSTIPTLITERADGVFLWASFMVNRALDGVPACPAPPLLPF